MSELLRKYWWLILLWITPVIIIGVTSQRWEVLAGIGTWLLAGGIGVAIWQIIETRRSTREQLEATRKSTNAQIAIGLSQKLRDKEVLEILQKIYKLEPERIASLPNSTEKKDEQLENEITRVLDNLELLGALVAQEIIDEGTAIVVYGGPTALKCWYKLNGYISKLRSTRHSLCGRYLEDFAARTWERSHREGQKIYFYRVKKERPIDLVKYFQDNPSLRPKRYN